MKNHSLVLFKDWFCVKRVSYSYLATDIFLVRVPFAEDNEII